MKRCFVLAPVLLLAACGPSESTTAPECGDGHVDEGEGCDDGTDNGRPGQCKSDCSGVPALAGVSGDVLAFAGEVGGPRVEGARVWVLENPDKSVVTGADAHFEIEGLDVGSEVTLVMEHPDFHTTQTATFVLGEGGIHPFPIQAVSTFLFKALSGIVPNPPQEDSTCSIATTVTRSGGSLYVHLRQGEAGASVALTPAAPAESGPIYFNEQVLPDLEQTSTSIDGGAIFANVPPGEYMLGGSKPGLVFQPVKLKCRVGLLVNAGPPLGVLAHVVEPDLAGGESYPDDGYSGATGALCEQTAACVEAKSPGRYPAANVASCKAMFKNALSFVDASCDGDAAFRDAWQTLFECRAQSCELALGGDEACPAEDAAFVAAMAAYGACYAKSHAP